MKLEDVLPALKAGKQIKRGNSSYPLDDGNYASPEDLLADDWEIVDPPPQKIEVTRPELFEAVLAAMREPVSCYIQPSVMIANKVCRELGFREK